MVRRRNNIPWDVDTPDELDTALHVLTEDQPLTPDDVVVASIEEIKDDGPVFSSPTKKEEDNMDTTVLTPGVGQSVVATHDHHGHHDRHAEGAKQTVVVEGRHGHDDWAKAGRDVKESEAAIRGDIGRSESSIRSDVKDAECGIRSDIGRAECGIRSDVKEAECDIRSDVKQAEANVRADVKNAECDLARDIKNAECQNSRDIKDARFDLTQEINRTFAATQLALCHTDELVAQASKETAVGFKDQLVTAYQVEGRQAVQAERLAAAAQLEAEKNTAAITLQAEKNASAVALQNEKIAAASALLATVNASTAAAQLAACCCELKEKITDDGRATRDLINTTEKDRLLQLLAAQQAEIALLKLTVTVGGGGPGNSGK